MSDYNTRFVMFKSLRGGFDYLFSDENLDNISKEITRNLRGLRSDGRDIVVSRNVILSVLNNITDNYTPQVGDIYTRYSIERLEERNDLAYISLRTVEAVVSYIKLEYETETDNSRFSVWDARLINAQDHNMTHNNTIKLNNRRPKFIYAYTR